MFKEMQIWKVDQRQKKEKTQGATGPGGRTTREQIEKWNQNDSPEILLLLLLLLLLRTTWL